MAQPDKTKSDHGFAAVESIMAFSGNLWGLALKYVVYYLVATLLGAAGAGLYFLGVTMVRVAGMLSVMGLDRGAIRYISIYNSSGDGARMKGTVMLGTLFVSITGIVIYAVLYFMAPWLAMDVYHKPGMLPVIRIITATLPLYGIFTFLASVLQGLGNMRLRVLCEEIIWPGATILLILPLKLVSAADLNTLAAVYIGATLLTAAASAALVWSKVGKAMAGAGQPVYETRTILGYSAPLMLRSVFVQALTWADIIMLGIFCSSSDVGVYFIASRFMIAVNAVNNSIGGVVSPMFAAMSNEGLRERMQELYKSAGKWIVAIETPVILFLVMCGGQILGIFGKEYSAGTAVLTVLILGQFTVALSGTAMHALIMCGHSKMAIINSSAGCLLKVGLNLLFIPRFGIMGAAISMIVVRLAVRTAQVTEVYFLEKMHPFSAQYFKVAAIGVVSSAALYGLRLLFPWLGQSVAGFCVCGALMGIILIAATKLFMTGDELREFKGLFSGAGKRMKSAGGWKT